MKRLENKVVIVTGSTSGIGVGIARLCALEGAKVVVCGRREEKGNAVVETIKNEGGEAWFHQFDITKLETIDSLLKDTFDKYGHIDVLVNNAANVALKDGSVSELTVEMWDAIFECDLRGTFYAIKSVLPYMEKNENGGSIINIGSMASINGDISSTAYACAKAGVDMLTKSVALQYGKKKIRCNCVRPGLIVTPENDSRVLPFIKNIFLDNIMVDRYGCPEDIGYMCVYLASNESAYVTGQVMTVDGGLNSHVPTVAQFRNLNKKTW